MSGSLSCIGLSRSVVCLGVWSVREFWSVRECGMFGSLVCPGVWSVSLSCLVCPGVQSVWLFGLSGSVVCPGVWSVRESCGAVLPPCEFAVLFFSPCEFAVLSPTPFFFLGHCCSFERDPKGEKTSRNLCWILRNWPPRQPGDPRHKRSPASVPATRASPGTAACHEDWPRQGR